jgi:peptidoglycan/LPS O-acetylase OafA/YrhL
MSIRTPKPSSPEVGIGKRLAFLDCLRGVAAMAVFISHAAERVSPFLRDIIHTRFDLGHFGVTLFFVCSGFIIPFSLERQNSLSSFWISRIFRLYPLYWFTIGLSVVLAFAASEGLSFTAFLASNSTMILGNLTMLQLFMGIPHIRGEYWTLSFEMLFYIVMSVLFMLKMNRYTLQLTFGLILMSFVVESIVPLMVGLQLPVGILSFLTLMFMGTTLYRVHTGELPARSAAVIGALGFVMLLVTPLSKGISEARTWEYLNLISARLAALIVFGLVFVVRSRTPARFMVYLGTISYSLYLMQTYVMIIDVHNSALNIVLWFAAQLIVATATYHWIEHPGIDCGRWLNRSLRTLLASPPRWGLAVKAALPPSQPTGIHGANESAEPPHR